MSNLDIVNSLTNVIIRLIENVLPVEIVRTRVHNYEDDVETNAISIEIIYKK
ncbi:MAG: hypothetical protein L0K82_07860 [Pisciglobus halotolerans]|nr:hypothetical protein [Pisciglobus halotolerans]